jgi:hypothetical protein
MTRSGFPPVGNLTSEYFKKMTKILKPMLEDSFKWLIESFMVFWSPRFILDSKINNVIEANFPLSGEESDFL